MKLLFMGTPEFAIPSLELLLLSAHRVLAVVTRPDRPSGRGKKLSFCPVKLWAEQRGLETWQPENLDDPVFTASLFRLSPDLIVTAAFGRLLPEPVLFLPPLGCINLHASYLPAYRGAAPIHRAVIEGASFTGVSIIQMTSGLDSGPVLMQEKEPVSMFDTAGMLHDRLAARGSALLLEALDALAKGRTESVLQDHSAATYARPLTPKDECLDWNKSALELYNRIRGLNPWPGAYTTLRGKRIKVWKAALPKGEVKAGQPGEILNVGERSLSVATAQGILTLLDLQPAGKKSMDAGSFCCGYRVDCGELLGGDL